MKDIKKLIALWKKQCSSTKIILFIGFACLMNVVISTLLGSNSFPENNMAIKSISFHQYLDMCLENIVYLVNLVMKKFKPSLAA